MTWNAYTMENRYEWVKNHHITALLITMLLSLIFLTSLNSVQGNIRAAKLSNNSKFTNPPLIPVTPTAPVIATKHCNISSSALKDGIECFENKLYNQAKAIFIRIKKEAINNKNRELLFKSQMYLAFISIDEGELDTATDKIKHLFFLRTDFNLKQYKINNTDYSNIFEEIHQHGRNIGEKETDDISKIEYTRVEHCLNDYCKDGVWQKMDMDTDLNCSINGTCNENTDESIECSINKTCNENIEDSLDCSINGSCKK